MLNGKLSEKEMTLTPIMFSSQRKRLSITNSVSDRSDSECGDVPNGSPGLSQVGDVPMFNGGTSSSASTDSKVIVVKVRGYRIPIKTSVCVFFWKSGVYKKALCFCRRWNRLQRQTWIEQTIEFMTVLHAL